MRQIAKKRPLFVVGAWSVPSTCMVPPVVPAVAWTSTYDARKNDIGSGKNAVNDMITIVDGPKNLRVMTAERPRRTPKR
jgi:hypothetical protein